LQHVTVEWKDREKTPIDAKMNFFVINDRVAMCFGVQ